MRSTLGDLFTSKKFLMVIIGAIVWFAGRYGIHLDADSLYPVLALLMAGIFGQAVADHGKAAAQVANAGKDAVALQEEVCDSRELLQLHRADIAKLLTKNAELKEALERAENTPVPPVPGKAA